MEKLNAVDIITTNTNNGENSILLVVNVYKQTSAVSNFKITCQKIKNKLNYRLSRRALSDISDLHECIRNSRNSYPRHAAENLKRVLVCLLVFVCGGC